MEFVSLGAGVQSTTMLLMAVHGEITPMPDAAIFADTGWEPSAVYRHLEWLESVSPVPIIRVSKGGGGLREDALSGRRFASMPLYVRSPEGKGGMLMRQCTQEYKIAPVKRKIREINGLKPCHVWIGISLDESQRMKDSRVKYIQHRWPLVDLKMTRDDCVTWMKANGYQEPPRSSCIGCPFHSNDEWASLSVNDFADAVDFDRQIRRLPRITGDAFLHRSMQPLDMVDLGRHDDDLGDWASECYGMCGS